MGVYKFEIVKLFIVLFLLLFPLVTNNSFEKYGVHRGCVRRPERRYH